MFKAILTVSLALDLKILNDVIHVHKLKDSSIFKINILKTE